MIRVFQCGQDISEVRVDAGNHRSPLPRLIGQRGVVRVVGVGFVPIGECGNFAERCVRYLHGKQAEERLARIRCSSCLGRGRSPARRRRRRHRSKRFRDSQRGLATQASWDSPPCFDNGPSSWRPAQCHRWRSRAAGALHRVGWKNVCARTW